jgi:dTDP-4-amino-4,6-dideoxygalactose transaminase
MVVPLQDLRRDQAALAEELVAAVREVSASSAFVLGTFVERFERAVARYIGAEHAVGVASGSDALILAMKALGIGRGDEVITTPLSFIATAGSIVHAGARPVFVDIRPDTYLIDPEAVAAAVSERTAAILPVHLYGQMADMASLRVVAARHGLAVIEDAAQAIGASQQRPGAGEPKGDPHGIWRAGAAADVGCFSFYPSKNLGAWGDGGLVATNSTETAALLRELRNHGLGYSGSDASTLGHNSRLDAIQAAVLHVKLPFLDHWTNRRQAHAARYDRSLSDLSCIVPPHVPSPNRHVYHQYTIRCTDRPAIASQLEQRQIAHRVYYPIPLHLLGVFKYLGHRQGDFPVAECASEEVLSLPVFPSLTSEEQEKVIGALRMGARAGSP